MIVRNSRGWIIWSFPGFRSDILLKDFDFCIVKRRWGSKERSGAFLKADRWFCNFEVQIYFYYFTYGPLKSFGCSKPDAGTYPVRDWANHGDEKDFVFGNYEKSGCPMDAWEALEDKNQCSLWPQNLNLKDLFHHTSTLQMGRV